MTDFKAAIFDLDGTLLDSMAMWEKISAEFLAKKGLPIPDNYSDEIYSLTFRDAARYTINLFGLSELEHDLIGQWNEMALHEYSHNVGLKPYAKEYLAALKSRGVKLATATALPHVLAQAALKNNGIDDYFDAYCSTDEVGRGKDFPDVFLLAAQRLAVPPEQCVVFEDLPQGVVSAKEAGMKVVCIYDARAREQRELMQKTADLCLHDFERAPIPAKC